MLLDDILKQAGCNTVDVERSGCLATVGQIRDCLDDLNGGVSELRYTLTCAAVGEPLDDDWWKIDMPQSCTTIENACD